MRKGPRVSLGDGTSAENSGHVHVHPKERLGCPRALSQWTLASGLGEDAECRTTGSMGSGAGIPESEPQPKSLVM